MAQLCFTETIRLKIEITKQTHERYLRFIFDSRSSLLS